MITHITWGQYWTAVITLSAIYYFFIALLFYRNEISGLLRAKINHHRSDEDGVSADRKEKGQQAGIEGLEPVVADIKSIMTAAGNDAPKEPLLEAIKARVADYQGMGHPAFRQAINQYIIRNAEHICGVGFEEEDLEAAWESLPR